MRFIDDEEVRSWAAGHGYQAVGNARAASQLPHVRVKVPFEPGVLLTFCRRISACLSPRASCLLWVLADGIWPSSENWHLYYRIRQSYGEQRLLHEARGHVFLDYEEADFVSFLEITLLSGWDAEILPHLTYGGAETARAFIAHDEWVLLAHCEEEVVARWQAEFANGYQVL